MRTRSTTTGGFNDENLYEQCFWDGCTPTAWTYSGHQVVKTITDVQTPGFHALQKCGKFLPLNPLTVETVDEMRIPGVLNNYTSPNEAWHVGKLWDANYTVPIPDPNPDLLDAAVLAAAANAAAAEMDVLTFLAEFKKSVDLLGDLYRRFNKAMRSMARGARHRNDFKNPSWKQLRQYWLEARYGVRPIVYDVFNVSNALSKTFENGLLLSGKGLQVEELDYSEDSGWHSINWAWDARTTFERTGKRKYRGKAYCLFDSERAATWGFNPLVTAWELVPYSFVVDWFIDIGAWVQTLGPQLSGAYEGICESTQTSVSETVQQMYRPTSLNSGPIVVSTTSRKLERYVRSPSSVPFPPLLPQLTLPKVIDLVALAFSGRRDVSRIMNRR